MRSKNDSYKRLCQDLELLGMRHRRGHDLRRTMISLARTDGARKDLLELCTHNPHKKQSTIDVYTEFPWEALCAEVAKLKVKRQALGQVITLPLARAVGDDELPGTAEEPSPHVVPALALVRTESAQSDPAEGRGGEDASASSPSPRRGFATSLATSGRKAEQDQGVKEWRRRESNLGKREPESPCETRTWPSKCRRSFRKVRSAAPRLVP
jgi:hypothetical protein